MPRSTAKTQQKQPATKAAATTVSKKQPATKGVAKKTQIAHKSRPIFEKRPRNFSIGGDIQPKRDLTRFVKWPKYIRLQRQRQVLLKRLKVPPAVNQFKTTLHQGDAKTLFALLDKYRPESRPEKQARLKALAAAGPDAKPDTKKPKVVHYGLSKVSSLVESRKAKLVIISHDVDPLELVIWLPTLCRKKDIPYVIVKGKSRLGRVVHKKTTSVLAITDVDQKDQANLALIVQKARDNFNGRYPTAMKTFGGKAMGAKHRAAQAQLQKRRTQTEKK
jgi:large subunit ribosomal protein L7Ae